MPDAYELANGNVVRLEHLTHTELRQCLTENPHMEIRQSALVKRLMNDFGWSAERTSLFVQRYSK